jgi:hypothetical protein
VYGYGQRLAHCRHCEVETFGDGNEVLLGHHGVLGHPPTAGEADGNAIGTQLRGTGQAGLAAATTLYRDRDVPVSGAHPRHARSDCLDRARELVAQRYRGLNPLEPSVRTERVNIAAADATGGYAKQHLSGTRPAGLYVLDTGFSRLVTRFRESLHLGNPEVT